MEILSTDDEAPDLVTNLEVMNILSSQQASSKSKRKKSKRKVPHVDWIQQHVLDYLKKTPCANVKKDRMPVLIEKLKNDFQLTDAEILQICNFMPTESVEIHLIIQDLPTRLSEERQEELLTLIGSFISSSDDTDKNGNAKLDADEEIVGEIPDDDDEPLGLPKEEEPLENGDSHAPAIKSEPS